MIDIVFVISSLSGKGGMERVATLLASILVKENHNITIITRGDHSEKCWFDLEPMVNVIKVSGNLTTFLKTVQEYVKYKRPNYVVAHNMGKMTLALSILSYKKYGCQLVSFEHVADVTSPKYVQLLKRVLYKKVDKVVVLSNDDEMCYKKFHKTVFKVKNPNPYTCDNPDYDIDSRKIISIGRLTYQKGFDLLLRAWSEIEVKYPEWSYEIYGDGEDLEKLENLKKELGLKRLYFKGFSSNLKEVYSKSSFFVLSSRFEGFGMVLIEAHTFGLPTVSFDCPYGPSDIIENNYNGLLVSNGDVLELATSIELLIKNDILRSKLSYNALNSVKEYSKENIINNWNNVING